MAEILTAVAAAVTLANAVISLGKAIYKESDRNWKKFEEQVMGLTRIRKDWDCLVAKYDLERCKELVLSLEKVEQLLQKEEKKLEKRKEALKKRDESRASILEGILISMKFPVQVTRNLNEILKAYDDILSDAKKKYERVVAAQNEVLGKPASLGFSEDHELYVRPENTEQQVRESLAQSDDFHSKLVLLYGKPGQGKSTLARDVALQIQPCKPQLGSNHADSRSGAPDTSAKLQAVFEKVVFLPCGEKKDVLSLQSELRERLGWVEMTTPGNSPTAVQKSLESLLANSKLLIILDDVWEPELVLKMVKFTGGASHLKFLVTSQNAALCAPLRPTYRFRTIGMEVSNIEARKILARYILRLEDRATPENDTIPKNVEGCADEIIEMVERNLLAMACLGAAQFSRKNFEDLAEWRRVKDQLHGYLASPVTTAVHGELCPSTYWAALQFCLERLQDDEKRVLLLVVMCKEPVVPEEVVEFLYDKSVPKIGFRPFRSVVQTLAGRQLIRIEQRDCSIHSLLRIFLGQEYRASKDSIVSSLCTNDVPGNAVGAAPCDEDIVIAISTIYFEDHTFARRVAARLRPTLTTHGPPHRPICRADDLTNSDDLTKSMSKECGDIARHGGINLEGAIQTLLDVFAHASSSQVQRRVASTVFHLLIQGDTAVRKSRRSVIDATIKRRGFLNSRFEAQRWFYIWDGDFFYM